MRPVLTTAKGSSCLCCSRNLVIGEWTVELFCNKARDATLGPMIFACGREHVIRLAHIAASAVSEEVQYEQSFEVVLSFAMSER
jgi:hypothetical protein